MSNYVLVAVVLVNLLIASLNSTFKTIQVLLVLIITLTNQRIALDRAEDGISLSQNSSSLLHCRKFGSENIVRTHTVTGIQAHIHIHAS